MDLAQYLKEEGITLKDFAKKIGISRSTLTNYKYRLKDPLPAYADKIFRVTGGKVTAKDISKKSKEVKNETTKRAKNR